MDLYSDVWLVQSTISGVKNDLRSRCIVYAWQEEQELAKDVDADLRKDDKNEKKSIFNRFLK